MPWTCRRLAAGGQAFSQGTGGAAGTPERLDLFAMAVATGGFNGDGFVDLTAGVPFEVIGATVDAGAVKALYGSAGRSTGAES